MALKLLRLFAVVYAVILPVQGMAAVAAGLCMATGHHEGMQGASAEAHDQSNHSGDAHDEMPGAEAADDGKSAHCAPCTACCASASIAGPAPVAIASFPSAAPYVFAQYPPPSVPLEGLDRPPLAL